jgi:hypothetical protein
VFFPTKNNIKTSRWATLYIEFISLNHYVIPYLINDIILDDHFNTTKWTFMKFFNHQIEPPYHAFTLQLNGFLILKHFPKKTKINNYEQIKYPSNTNKYQCWEFSHFLEPRTSG